MSSAIMMFPVGVLGDAYDIRKLLALYYFGIAIGFALQAVAGFIKLTSLSFYYTVFVYMGLINAFIVVSLLLVISNWYSKKNRGLIVGLWATYQNIGNIIGS